MLRPLLVSLLSLSVVACAAQQATNDDPEAASSQYAAALSTTDSAAILALVNYPGTDANVLDKSIGLDARAVKGILALRDGADGLAPSGDDVPFATLATLDAVPYVGDAAFQKLAAYAAAHPAPSAETVEGVAFAGWESQSVVYGVNQSTLAQLDAVLDDRAAKSLFDHRPYTTVAAMGPESYVGAAALNALHKNALTWWNAMRAVPATLAGTYDGVDFYTEALAVASLEIANEANLAQLTANSITTGPADAIMAGRRYTTLAGVAAVKGVGQATMQSLLFYARSGTFISPVTGFTLDAATITAETSMLKEGLVEDEGFAEYVLGLAGNKDEAVTIMNALSAEIDKLTAPLVGGIYLTKDDAIAAVAGAAPVKQRTKDGGWTYLASLGVVQPGTATCTATFDGAVGPHLADVLFLSESDRDITLVSYPGAGGAAPTAASVLALLGSPAGYTAQLRDPASFYGDLEPSGAGADSSAPAAIQAAFTAQLKDVVYVAVFPPAGSIDQASVQVYLVGRTSCGDLVGLTSISIET